MGSKGKMFWTTKINETIPASNSFESEATNISGLENFSVLVSSVSGDFTIGYKAALEEAGPFIETGALITDSVTEPSFLRFNPVIAPFIKLVATNNSGTTPGDISVVLIHRTA